MTRYPPPQGAPGVYEAWAQPAWKNLVGSLPDWKAAGLTGWRITQDVFGNCPRRQVTLEFETIEQAIA